MSRFQISSFTTDLESSATPRWNESARILYSRISRNLRCIAPPAQAYRIPDHGNGSDPGNNSVSSATLSSATASSASLGHSPKADAPGILPLSALTFQPEDSAASPTPPPSNPGLSQASLTALLQRLDPDPERAGEEYLRFQQKLTRFFEYRGCEISAELADETLNRVGTRLSLGVRVRELNGYLYGIARHVLSEYHHQERLFLRLEDLKPAEQPTVSPEFPARLESSPDEIERTLECLEQCLAEMPRGIRELLHEYYGHECRVRVEKRRALARKLGISPNALKLRIWRVRESLERRVSRRLRLTTNS